MTDSKISALPDGGAFEAGDELVVARAGGDYRIAADKLHPNRLARDLGLVAWSLSPAEANLIDGTQTNTHLVAVELLEGDVVSSLAVFVHTAGAGMTFGGLGIYDAGLNLLASKQTTGVEFQAAGWVPLALDAAWTCPASGVYYLASAYEGTTLPSVLNSLVDSGVLSLPGAAKPLGVHAQVPAGALPNPAVAQGAFTNFPLIVAY